MQTPLYLAVSLFLALTAVFFAAVTEAQPGCSASIFSAWLVAGDPHRHASALRAISMLFRARRCSPATTARPAPSRTPTCSDRSWCCPAVYHALPADDRAASPAMPLYAVPLLIVTAGIFFSFSRGAWGLFAAPHPADRRRPVPAEPSGLFRLRIVVMSLLARRCFWWRRHRRSCCRSPASASCSAAAPSSPRITTAPGSAVLPATASACRWRWSTRSASARWCSARSMAKIPTTSG